MLLLIGLVVALGCCCCGSLAYVPNILHPSQSALIKLNNYDAAARPPGVESNGDPINVTVNIFLRSIDSLDYFTNEFKIQITLREEWTDSRLAFTGYSNEITLNNIEQFWMPDIFFSNEAEGHLHTITKPNAFVRIDSSGKVLLSSRISLTLKCPMSMAKFPFDSQSCAIRMPSYGYTTNDVTLQWKEEDPIQVTKTMSFLDFTLRKIEPIDCTQVTNTGAYGCLEASFVFDRNADPYIVQVFIPLIALVTASWTSFWLPSSAVVVRLFASGLVTLITTLFTIHEKEILGIPPFTILDFWSSVSTLFVYLAFFQFLLLTYRKSKNSEEHMQESQDAEDKAKFSKILWIQFPSEVSRIDAVSRILFPAAYLSFNIFFFITVSTLI